MSKSKNSHHHATTQTNLNIRFRRKKRSGVRDPLFKSNNVFIFFTLKQVLLEPHKEIVVDMQIQIDYPTQLIPEFILLSSLTKLEIESDFSDYKPGEFYQIKLFNKSFSDTIRIKKNTGIVAMYFLNDKDYIFNIKNSYV